MSFSYGRDECSDDLVKVLESAISLGRPAAAVMLDTADVYGPFTNELLLGSVTALRGSPSVLLASKGGLVATGQGNRTRPNGRPDHLRSAVNATLRRLGIEQVELYYLHRVDPDVPIEESWGALMDLVVEGKLGGLGLSEVSIAELELAQAIHPVTAVQSELSLFRRVQLAEVVPWCERHGVVFVAYAPLGRGYLSGTINEATSLGQDDFRRHMPMFAEDARRENQALLVHIREVARRHNTTPGQVALAWVRAQSPVVVALAGTRRVRRLQENVWSQNLALGEDELALLGSAPTPTQARYAK